MSFFKKLKKNIGVSGEENKQEKKVKLATVPPEAPAVKKAVAASAEVSQGQKKKASKEIKSAVKVEKIATSQKNEKKAKKAAVKKEPADWLQSEGQLAVDVYQTDNEFCVEAPIAGVEPEEIEVFVEDEMLVIKGERKESQEETGKDYFYHECYWGAFSRQISLPEDVDPSKVKAILKKGILKVTIPRAARAKKRKVSILSED